MKKSWRKLAATFTALAFFGFGLASCHGGDDDDPELKLSASANTVEVGSSITITAKYDGKDVTALAEFSSLDESKAVVELSEETAEDGTVTTVAKVTGKDSGTVEIQAKYKDTKKVKITVTPKTASSETVAGTYSFGDSTVVIAENGSVTVNGVTGYTIDDSTGAIIIKDSSGNSVYTIGTKSDGTIDTDSVMNADGEVVTVKELEKSYDGSLFLKLSSEPTYSAESKLYVIQNGATVDTITLDDKYYTINNSKGTIAEIKVKDQLVNFDDEGNVVIVTHTDSNGYSKLYAETTYTVKLDDTELGTYTTKANPTISDNAISVGTDGDFATIQGALNYIKKNGDSGDWTITVAEGKYHERLAYYGSANVTIVGASAENYGKATYVFWENKEGWNSGSRCRPTFVWQGGNLIIKNMTFENTTSRADSGANDVQAETLYFDVAAKLAVYKSSFISYQDTLNIGNNGGKAWFYDCYISGDVDFIWGTADVVLVENCQLVCRADGIKNAAEIFASRTVRTQEANKGYVLYNSKVLIEDGNTDSTFGRNQGGTTAVINTAFTSEGTGKLHEKLWGGANEAVYDIAGDIAVGEKDYGNTYNGETIGTTRLEGTAALSERVYNREYNGRYVIFNRGYDIENKVYKTVSDIWDLSALEADFSATEDKSKNNIFIEPVYKKNIVGGTEVELVLEKFNENSSVEWSSSKTDAATVENGVVKTVAGVDADIVITAKSGDNTDVALLNIVASYNKVASLSLEGQTKAYDLYDFEKLTATIIAEDTTKEVTNPKLTWSSSDTNVVKFGEKGEDSLTPDTEDGTVYIYAAGAGTATITATSDDGAKAELEVTITDNTAIGAVAEKLEFAIGDLSEDVIMKSKSATSINHVVAKAGTKPLVLKPTGAAYYELKTDVHTIHTKGTKSGNGTNRPGENNAWTYYDEGFLLKGVTGPFKITVPAGYCSSSRYFGFVFLKDGVAAQINTELMPSGYSSKFYDFNAVYEGTDTVDIVFIGGNDFYYGGATLAPYAEVAATSVSLSSESETLTVGGSVTLTATIAPENSTDTITWTSSDSTVASVADGVVTAKAAGTATITVKARDGVEKTCAITVNPVPTLLETVTWDFTSSATTKSVLYTDAALTTKDSSGKFEKSSGYVTGSTTLKSLAVDATSGKFAPRDADVQVNAGTKIKIPVSANSVVTITAKDDSSDSTKYVQYTVGDISAQARISTYTASATGYLELVATGACFFNKISVTNVTVADEHDAVATLTAVSATGITLDATNGTLSVGGTATVKATVTPENRTSAVTWESSDTNIATVAASAGDLTAKVTAKATGTAIITAKYGDGDGEKATYTLTVADEAATVDITWDWKTVDIPVYTKYENDAYTTPPSDNKTIQKTTGYAVGTSGSVAMFVDASAETGKFYDNGNNVAVNSGTTLYIPVSANSVLTVTAYDLTYAKNMKISNVAMTAAEHTYTVSGAGFVELEATDQGYLFTVKVTNVTRSDVLSKLTSAASNTVTATVKTE